jgi:hypothetical protein
LPWEWDVENNTLIHRALTLVISTLVAIAIIWRGCTYLEHSEGSSGMLAPVMCTLAALFCLLTGIALACQRPEADSPE